MIYKNVKICLAIVFSLTCQLAWAQQEPNVVMMFGDSITTGYPIINANTTSPIGISQGPSVEKLESLLDSSGRPTDVLNWGSGGTSSTQGLDRITNNINSVKSSHSGADAYFILIMYGTNDIGQGISSSTTGFNTRAMIDNARARGVVPIIGNLTPRADRDVTAHNSAIVSAANARNARLVDFNSAFNNYSPNFQALMNYEGGLYLHPNQTGYDFIATLWFQNGLKDLIEGGVSLSPIYMLLLDDVDDEV